MLKGKVLYDTVVLTTERVEEKLIITPDSDSIGEDAAGQVKMRQTVVLVGEMVKDIKPGEEVLLNAGAIKPDDKGQDPNIVYVPFEDVMYMFVPRRYVLYVFGKGE